VAGLGEGVFMDILSKECIATVTLFDVRVSEGELMVFADCMRIVMEKYTDSEIAEMTVCESKQELSFFLSEVTNVVREMERQDYLPDRFKS
jgi:ribosome-binding protein aMBF1 (putative translation factor)